MLKSNIDLTRIDGLINQIQPGINVLCHRDNKSSTFSRWQADGDFDQGDAISLTMCIGITHSKAKLPLNQIHARLLRRKLVFGLEMEFLCGIAYGFK